MIARKQIKVGLRIFNGTAYKGVVDEVTFNYARIQWQHQHEPDILSKTSPLWRFLDAEK
jgi:type VI protein secretion system component Hcp